MLVLVLLVLLVLVVLAVLVIMVVVVEVVVVEVSVNPLRYLAAAECTKHQDQTLSRRRGFFKHTCY